MSRLASLASLRFLFFASIFLHLLHWSFSTIVVDYSPISLSLHTFHVLKLKMFLLISSFEVIFVHTHTHTHGEGASKVTHWNKIAKVKIVWKTRKTIDDSPPQRLHPICDRLWLVRLKSSSIYYNFSFFSLFLAQSIFQVILIVDRRKFSFSLFFFFRLSFCYMFRLMSCPFDWFISSVRCVMCHIK